jgi:hypothetical protein
VNLRARVNNTEKHWSLQLPHKLLSSLIYLLSVVRSWDMETFILTFLLVVIIHNILLYFRTRRTQGTRSTNFQIDSERNETDTEGELLSVSDCRNTGESVRASETTTMTALTPSGECTGCGLHDLNVHPPSTIPPSVPLPASTLIGSYHEIVAAITRYVRA